MATVESNLEQLKPVVDFDEDLDSDEISKEDVNVKIAIFGKSGSGRTSFVNVIRG